MRRFVVRRDLIARDRVHFDAAETRHLARVLRLVPGTLVEVLDGGGHRLLVRLEAIGPGQASGAIVADLTSGGTTGESPCRISLAPALLKGDRMSWLVQKATELGVSRILPVVTDRSVVRGAPRELARVERWQRVAREAVKQCGRARVPLIERPRPFREVLTEVGACDRAWVCAPAASPTSALLSSPPGPPPATLFVLVGPEGGFGEDELRAAQAAGALPVALGPRTLRAESAALVALVLGQYLFGDLRGG
jgi:16S rRNA (uracil1498-N3)-methyltransferase